MLAEGMRGFAQAEEDALFDRLAEQEAPHRRFLRARWFSAGQTPDRRIVAMDERGHPLAALALVVRRKGPLALREIGGCYWPFRGVALASGASVAELAAALRAHRDDLGRVWRLGPAESGDPALTRLTEAAERAGWHALRRPLGTLFELDLGGSTAGGEWPSSRTQRKNRWRKRRLEEDRGALRTEFFTGADWTAAQRDAMATIEARSWLGSLEDGGDTKFRDPAMRAYWERLCDDPALAGMLFGSLLWLGETPAAFTFGIEAGDRRYYIANNYDERFTRFGPGRVLLYDDFARAAANGTTRVSWGLGDAGYKSEMGAMPSAELHDLLFVRGSLPAALLRPLWEREA